jgi:hypothetical protein
MIGAELACCGMTNKEAKTKYGDFGFARMTAVVGRVITKPGRERNTGVLPHSLCSGSE